MLRFGLSEIYEAPQNKNNSFPRKFHLCLAFDLTLQFEGKRTLVFANKHKNLAFIFVFFTSIVLVLTDVCATSNFVSRKVSLTAVSMKIKIVK